MRAPSRFLQAVVNLAIEAGVKVLEVYRVGFRLAHRDGRIWYSDADLVSHHFLTERLALLGGGFPVLSEQSALPSWEERSGWETYWLVDPLRGVDAFARHGADFTVDIALIHRNRPVLGVVYAPSLQTCYFAAEGCGAFKQTAAGEPHEIQVRMQSPAHPAVLVHPLDPTPAVEGFLGRLGECDFNRSGRGMEFCLVAEGLADLAMGFEASAEWNTAAIQCILEAAGGALTDLAGQRLLYNAKPALLNPFFLAYGDKNRPWTACAEGVAGSPPSAPVPPSPLLKAVIELALEAGAKLLAVYHSEFRVGHKPDHTPFTAGDLVSHHCLSEKLPMLNGLPVLSEESVECPFDEREAWDAYWLVDPLDGTREFIKHSGEFTINIALIRYQQPVLAVVYAPTSQTCYFAEEACGAYRRIGQAEATALHVRPLPLRPVVLSGHSSTSPELAEWLQKLGAHELHGLGGALKFCRIAEGKADFYPCLGESWEWHTAAGQCILEAAQGAVLGLDGKKLLYNRKASLRNPPFLALGGPEREESCVTVESATGKDRMAA